jgi:hypothetical protein
MQASVMLIRLIAAVYMTSSAVVAVTTTAADVDASGTSVATVGAPWQATAAAADALTCSSTSCLLPMC